MARMIDFLPELEDEEAVYVSKLMLPMEDEEAKQFSRIYRARRQDPQTILLTAILGFFLAAGIHRFLLGQIGMGVLYLLTGGLCLIGTIVDLVNYKSLAFEYNRGIAREAASMV